MAQASLSPVGSALGPRVGANVVGPRVGAKVGPRVGGVVSPTLVGAAHTMQRAALVIYSDNCSRSAPGTRSSAPLHSVLGGLQTPRRRTPP
jgi:hypothetical protein